jgi:phosphinothricin acetyltransferase
MLAIRTMTAADWVDVSRIYQQGIDTRIATFESAVPAWEAWNQSHLAHGRLLAVDAGGTLGWAALTAVSHRCVYGGVAEVSVYVGAEARGRGVGKALLHALIDHAEQTDLWTLQASIFRINEASIALHSRCGFRMVGYRERIAQQDGVWYDTVLMERRSAKVGQ